MFAYPSNLVSNLYLFLSPLIIKSNVVPVLDTFILAALKSASLSIPIHIVFTLFFNL